MKKYVLGLFLFVHFTNQAHVPLKARFSFIAGCFLGITGQLAGVLKFNESVIQPQNIFSNNPYDKARTQAYISVISAMTMHALWSYSFLLFDHETLMDEYCNNYVTPYKSFYDGIKHGFTRSPITSYAELITKIQNKIIKKKSYEAVKPDITFDAVAGAEVAKKALEDIVSYLNNPAEYTRLGARVPKGILLTGNPGNGKTLLARATAGQAQCTFIDVKGSEFVELYVGVAAGRIRDLFKQARKYAPCIVFIDEIDAIGKKRGASTTNSEIEQALNQLLTEMDGFDQNKNPIIVIAATNTPDSLDAALLRSGRFDRQITVPYPKIEDREAILQVHLKKIKAIDSLNILDIADKTAGFSGSDLENLVNQATILASHQQQEYVTNENFDEAIKSVAKKVTKSFVATGVKETFESVAGAQEAKEELQDVVTFLKDPKKITSLGAKPPRGVLLTGDPGNGKTLLARSLAGEAHCQFLSVSASEITGKFIGDGVAIVKDIFTQARNHAPCIIFIDEIDAIGKKRTSDGANSEYDKTLNQLLTEMDGFLKDEDPIIIVAATNRPDILDPALIRPGRFDRIIHVPFPIPAEREEILKIHAQKIKLASDVNFKDIARVTTGFSGAQLKHLILQAATLASKRNAECVAMEDIQESRNIIIMGKETHNLGLSDEEKKITAFHEAGHALVTLLKPHNKYPLYNVTIVPRSQALGLTVSVPEKEIYSMNQQDLLTRMQIALGGRIAEEIAFGQPSTGASNDFEQVTTIARNMVCKFGMSSLGTVVYSQPTSIGDFVHSQETSSKIDAAVSAIIQDTYNKTYTLLMENKDKLEKLAYALLEKETLYANEIYELLGIAPRTCHILGR